MDKFKLDPNELEKKLNTPKSFKLADVKDKIKKVAFDVVTFRNDPETLWRIVSEEDGDYIVANYEDNVLVSESVENKSSIKESWKVYTDKMQKTATIFYKKTAIKHVPLDTIEDPEDFKYRIPKILSKSASLVDSLLNSLDRNFKEQVLNLYPELKK
jgi:hypothetical protein